MPRGARALEMWPPLLAQAEIDAMQSTVSSPLICAQEARGASSRTKCGASRLQVQYPRHDQPPLPSSRPRTREYSPYEAASISPETPPTLCRSYSAERPLAQGRALPVARPTDAAQAYMEVVHERDRGTCAGTSGRVHGQSTCVFLTDTRSGPKGPEPWKCGRPCLHKPR